MTELSSRSGRQFLHSGRGTQVVRERSAKPLCVGSIPTRASNLSSSSLIPRNFPSFFLRARSASIGQNRAIWASGADKSRTRFWPSVWTAFVFGFAARGLISLVSNHRRFLVFGSDVNVSEQEKPLNGRRGKYLPLRISQEPAGFQKVQTIAGRPGDQQAALPSAGISWGELADRYRRRAAQ